MTQPIDRRQRRHLLMAGAALAAPALPGWAQERRFEPQAGAWRTFEVTTTVNVADVKGATRIWLPLPDVDTDYQKSAESTWSGNATSARIVADPARGVRMLYAEFEPAAGTPTLTLTSRLRTRNRAVDWSEHGRISEDPALLRANLAPTTLLPTDGIVRKTALEATKGAKTDVEKARAIYRWVVANAHREPKVRGCGTGDIKAMLETGNLGGKCADLNAVFVGLCRSVGVPARDVYGLRLAPSAFGYRELGANSASLKGAQHCRAEAWLAVPGATSYSLTIGSQPDRNDIFDRTTTGTSIVVPQLPCDARLMWVRLNARIGGTWMEQRPYIFQAAESCAAGVPAGANSSLAP